MTIEARDARLEAQQLLAPGDGEARVLEPSPPAVTSDPFRADDPVDRTRAASNGSDVELVLPTGLVDPARDPATVIDWETWLDGQPSRAEHEAWIAERWLGGRRWLPATPPSRALVQTRVALHRLAAYVIAPVRHRATGKFGLRWTLGGFGTPFFGQDRQVRVAGTELVDQRGGAVRTTAITSLADAALFLETDIDGETAAEHDSPELGDVDRQLAVDGQAAEYLGHWFGMAFAALEALRADAASIEPSRPQLWPGHFDPAVEVGTDDTRASYGASPGDHDNDRPYLYVSLWWPDRLELDTNDPFWNAPAFTGRILHIDEFPEDTDPAVVAADFWRETRDRLHQ